MKRKKKATKKPKKQLVPRTRNANTLTESQFFSKLRSGLRRTFQWYKPMMIALEMASRPYKGKNKLQKKEYVCCKCGGWFKRKEVQCHHNIPCGSLSSYSDVVPFIIRLTEEDPLKYSVMCYKCHSQEHAELKEAKKNKNGNN